MELGRVTPKAKDKAGYGTFHDEQTGIDNPVYVEVLQGASSARDGGMESGGVVHGDGNKSPYSGLLADIAAASNGENLTGETPQSDAALNSRGNTPFFLF